jgi:hypothetical protein
MYINTYEKHDPQEPVHDPRMKRILSTEKA